MLLLRWTRREEADFYRVVSTFGVVFDPSHSRFDWTKFRAMARLHKKTDESLQKYLCAFTAMCRRVCRLPPKEGGGKPARPLTPTPQRLLAVGRMGKRTRGNSCHVKFHMKAISASE